MHDASSLRRSELLGPTVTLGCLTHLQRFPSEAIDAQFTTSNAQHVVIFLHVREAGWVSLKVLVPAGGDSHPVPIRLKTPVGMNALDGSAQVLGLAAMHIGDELPPADEF